MKYKRVFLIVTDSLGCGFLPDSSKYDDFGSNTFMHIWDAKPDMKIPNLLRLGIQNVIFNTNNECISAYGKCAELSIGKDTLTGHYEMMGIKTEKPFLTFTDTGFPKDLIEEIEFQTGYKVIGNIAASGTEIIKYLGEEHMKTKSLIVYTSSDSVLQIACHEEIFGLQELYNVCETVREICLKPKWKVARIIARPFIGTNKNDFVRTSNRHDYALTPPKKTTLDYLKENNINVIGLGKISDIYTGCGITESIKTISNDDGMDKLLNIIGTNFNEGLYFINLVDFDSLYGHRRDTLGYAKAIEDFDIKLSPVLEQLKDDDLLIITADHGNDPTWKGTDHTREYVPLIVYNKHLKSINLGIRETFADIGQTIAENFNVQKQDIGTSFLKDLK